MTSLLLTVSHVSGKQCGENLTIADQSAIRVCINDFVVRGLLPFNERRMRALNEVSHRLGDDISFISAGDSTSISFISFGNFQCIHDVVYIIIIYKPIVLALCYDKCKILVSTQFSSIFH